jgi:hypothetical protein
MDRFPFPFVREFIDRNGGQAAFEGLTTDLNLQHGDTKGCECVCGFACHFSRPQNKAVRWAMQHKDLLFLFFLCRPKHAVILCCQCAAFECSKKHGEHGNDEHESWSLKGWGRAAAVAVIGLALSECSWDCGASSLGSNALAGAAARGYDTRAGHALVASVGSGQVYRRACGGGGGGGFVALEGMGRRNQDGGENDDLKKLHGMRVM